MNKKITMLVFLLAGLTPKTAHSTYGGDKAARIKFLQEAFQPAQTTQTTQGLPTQAALTNILVNTIPSQDANYVGGKAARIKFLQEAFQPSQTTQGLPTQTNPGTSSAFQPSQTTQGLTTQTNPGTSSAFQPSQKKPQKLVRSSSASQLPQGSQSLVIQQSPTLLSMPKVSLEPDWDAVMSVAGVLVQEINDIRKIDASLRTDDEKDNLNLDMDLLQGELDKENFAFMIGGNSHAFANLEDLIKQVTKKLNNIK